MGRLLGVTLMSLILPTFVLSLGAAVLHWDRSRLWSSGVPALFDGIGVAELLRHRLADRLVGVPDMWRGRLWISSSPAFPLVLSVALLALLLAAALLGHACIQREGSDQNLFTHRNTGPSCRTGHPGKRHLPKHLPEKAEPRQRHQPLQGSDPGPLPLAEVPHQG